MRSINRLLILTIVFNFFILIGAGHGVVFLGLIEILGPIDFFRGEIQFSFTGDYESRLFTAAFIASVGQIILIFSYFRKIQHQKFKLIYTGLFLLFFSFLILVIELLDSTLDSFSFWSGLPFLFISITLLIRTVKCQKNALST